MRDGEVVNEYPNIVNEYPKVAPGCATSPSPLSLSGRIQDSVALRGGRAQGDLSESRSGRPLRVP